MLNIDLRHLRYFVAVAEELHFGRAASRLGIQQPPLSQQIKQLESEIGHALFIRTSRTVALTAAGRELLERAHRILSRVQEDINAVRRIGRGEVGTLNIGFAGSAMLTVLPEVIRIYRRQYPDVQLTLREMVTSMSLEQLREGTIDLAFLRDPGEIEGYVIESLLTESYIAVLPAKHRLAGYKSISPAKLKGERLIFYGRKEGPVAFDKTIALCERAGFKPEIVQEAPQWPTAVRLVAAGLGYSIAPACVAKLGVPGVVFRRIAAKGAFTEIALGRRDEPMTPTADAFLKLAKETFGSHRSEKYRKSGMKSVLVTDK